MDKMTIGELWNAIRGLENAYRYYGCIVAALIPRVPGGIEFTIDVDKEDVVRIKGAWPNMCIPPWCRRVRGALDELKDEAGMRAAALGRIAEQLRLQVGRLDAPIEYIDFHADEVPGTRWPTYGEDV